MSRSERAVQMWSLLVLAARYQKILSYVMVERLTGIDKRGVGKILGPIQDYCKRHKFPPLTCLVVKEETGLPGSGFKGLAAQGRVFAFDWFKRNAPTAEDFSIRN